MAQRLRTLAGLVLRLPRQLTIICKLLVWVLPPHHGGEGQGLELEHRVRGHQVPQLGEVDLNTLNKSTKLHTLRQN